MSDEMTKKPNKKDTEKQNEEYLKSLLGENDKKISNKKEIINDKYDAPTSEYMSVDLSILPAGMFYNTGTKISIRSSKVSEIQAYSMVDDNNFVDITEKMNELLSKNIIFYHSNGGKGSYKDLKDADRMFLIFMIRELTFQGGNTLTKEVVCPNCEHEFSIPFRSTPGQYGPSTFELYEPNESITKFYNKEEKVYELLYKGVSWRLAPPTIGIQEDFYDEIKRNVQMDKKPNVAFMKIVPFLLYNRSSITTEGIKAKLKEFSEMNDLVLFQGLNELINNMTVGIKGLKMVCSSCGEEVHTELSFPTGASKLFEFSNILDRFGK